MSYYADDTLSGARGECSRESTYIYGAVDDDSRLMAAITRENEIEINMPSSRSDSDDMHRNS